MASIGTVEIPVRIVFDHETRDLLDRCASHLEWQAEQGMEGSDMAAELAEEIRELVG